MNLRKFSSVRVIAGTHRGRKITFPNLPELRPSGDRLRETLFNWLMHETNGAKCLDLFAGSGCLGIEALSRGAKEVLFLEQNPLIAQHLCQFLEDFFKPEHSPLPASKVLAVDTLNFLEQKPTQNFDIVFLDPPFSKNYWLLVLNLLAKRQWVHPKTLVYVELPVGPERITPLPCGYRVIKKTSMGKVEGILLIVE